MNIYGKMAHMVVVFHLIWIGILFLSMPLAFFQWYRPIAMIIGATTVASQIVWLGCPLTILENSLRKKAGEDVYDRSFVCHYLKKFNIDVPPILIVLQPIVFAVIFGILFI